MFLHPEYAMLAIRLPLLLAVFLMQAVAETPLQPLLDFVGPDTARKWQAVNDNVVGGVSDGRFKITADSTLEFSGKLSLENNGGFASVRSGGEWAASGRVSPLTSSRCVASR